MSTGAQGKSGETFAMGEHLFGSLLMAKLAERYKPGDPMRGQMEAVLKDCIPILWKQRHDAWDAEGTLLKRVANMEVLLSQKEALAYLSEKATGIEATKTAVTEALAAGDVKGALQKGVFFLLQHEHFRDLKHPCIEKLVELARKTGDTRLFMRLGRALSKKPVDSLVDTLQYMLAAWWSKVPGMEIGLCHLTDQALADFCNLAMHCHGLTLDSVRKVRQRLLLKKAVQPSFNKVEKTTKGFVFWRD